MSMHLVGPWLTTTSTKKRKTKFKSAEHKRKFEQQAAEWEALMAKYKPKKIVAGKPSNNLKDTYKLTVPAERDTKQYPSLMDKHGIVPGTCAKPAPKVYTGDKLIGIATMHKSNMVPVFKVEDAEDIARMRR
jgi:hypothetical protein